MTYRLFDLCKMVLSKMPLKSLLRGGADAATIAVQISTFALSEASAVSSGVRHTRQVLEMHVPYRNVRAIEEEVTVLAEGTKVHHLHDAADCDTSPYCQRVQERRLMAIAPTRVPKKESR